MKYEVIGWTYCGDQDYLPHQTITASVDMAIVQEIRKHGYLFGGDKHEEYCPVLNDGTYVDYSWRGWGRIIALAYEIEGKYSYMYAYMDSLIDPKARKYPEHKAVEDIRIVPKESLAETFVMHLSDDMFEKVKAGTKTVEVRLFDDKRKKVDIDDYIEFRKKSDEADCVIRKVADIAVIEKSFADVFTTSKCLGNRKWEDVLRFSPQSLGAVETATIASLVENMYRYYDKAEEEKYGVIAFILEEAKPTCWSCFKVLLDGAEWNERYSKKIVTTSTEELWRWMDREQIEKAFHKIAPFVGRWDYFSCGENTDYDVDINRMIRKTLAELFGKEEQIKEFQDQYYVVLELEIFAVVVKDTDQPQQRLSLDQDIIEFLYKTDTKLKFSCKVI